MKIAIQSAAEHEAWALRPHAPSSPALFSLLERDASALLESMFRDPRVLESDQRRDLIASLRRTVDLAPDIPETRVLLGMALCVDLQAQEALDHLRTAVDLAPDSFIARLKLGELLMRLRICDQAADHTHCAAQLASNAFQSELARRQAAAIRGMQREGIERGGYSRLLPGFGRFQRMFRKSSNAPALVASK